MHPGGSAGQPAPADTGTVTGHSYTAAYRYQLVIGKVGGWAIPYPMTIPQAVTGLSAVVFAMVTASWWYPLTGVGGLLGVVALPIVGIRVISRIRPEGRSVSDWLYGWGVAQGHSLMKNGVRLQVGLSSVAPVRDAHALAEPMGMGWPGDREAVGGPQALVAPGTPEQERSLARSGGTSNRRRQVAAQSMPLVPAGRATPTRSPRRSHLTGLIASLFPGRSAHTPTNPRSKPGARPMPSPHQGRQTRAEVSPPTGLSDSRDDLDPGFRYDRGFRSGRDGYLGARRLPASKAQGTRDAPTNRRSAPGRLRQHHPAAGPTRTGQAAHPSTSKSVWSAITQFFRPAPPTPAARVPVFDPWGVTHVQGGT